MPFQGQESRTESRRVKKVKGCDGEKEERRCMMASGRTQKCHEREEQRLRKKEREEEGGVGVPLPKQHSILCPVLKDVTYFSSLCWLF